MGITLTQGAVLTLAFMPVVGFQPVSQQPLRPAVVETSVPSRTGTSRHFKPDYIIVDNKVEEIGLGISTELDVISSFLDIGNILFKDCRSETIEELQATRSYFKSKYKKA